MFLSIYIDKNELFHVHTYRCGHAENVPDEAYVKKAVELGAAGIFFTDHTPFPGNDIPYRMDIEELPEYLGTIHSLRDKYAGVIDVRVGLEIEYFPSFQGYYEKLREDPLIDLMMIGQHAYEVSPGLYSFQLDLTGKRLERFEGFGEAMIRGMESGMFEVIAHPDRMFTGEPEWTKAMDDLSRRIIECACRNNVKLEKNLESVKRGVSYWEEFWDLVPEEAGIVVGTDSHSIADLVLKWEMQQKMFGI